MPAADPSKIRNVAVIGHRGTGKTSLTEAILFSSGAVNRQGTVEQGTTVADHEEDEKKRQMSISASLCHLSWRERNINLLDTPGDPSFHADTIAALRVVEGAVVAVNAAVGVEVQHERLWKHCEDNGVSRMIFVNMMDRERADFTAAVEQLQESFGQSAVAAQLPIGAEDKFEGLVDLLSLKAYRYDGGKATEGEIPADMADMVEMYRDRLMDAVSENDDAVMEKYLEGEEISNEELYSALKAGVAAGSVFPIGAGCATKLIGVNLLLDLLVDAIPSPVKHGAAKAIDTASGEEIELECKADGPLAAMVFKTLADPFSGRINVMRVFSGEISSDSNVFNPVSKTREHIGKLLRLQGKDNSTIDVLGPGDIGAVAKLKATNTGDSLCEESKPITFPAMQFPNPVMSFAVEPKSKGDEEKIGTSLKRLQEEDPTLVVKRDPQTNELIVSGISQVHVEVVVERMKQRFGVEVELKPPRVPYLETIRKKAKAQGKYKKQTGGRGQYGDAWLEIEPLPSGDGFEFVDKVVGGVIPRGFIPAVEKGVIEAMKEGELAGSPLVDMRVTVYDGSHHPVDSSEMAFKIAASMGLKKAVAAAGPVILEPIMTVQITVPEENVGDIIGDMNSRRGKVLGMEPKGKMNQVNAEVPLSEMLSYAPDLRSMTGGRGDYTMDFLRYEEVPAHMAQKIVDQMQAEKVEK
ncbi:MAG: elongation factor G [Actinobacteria bacterium]|nr:elongation factor G [Actinomycetota bacterium]MCL5883547.1 elongation factor G [Actinomycetota bacterium]